MKVNEREGEERAVNVLTGRVKNIVEKKRFGPLPVSPYSRREAVPGLLRYRREREWDVPIAA